MVTHICEYMPVILYIMLPSITMNLANQAVKLRGNKSLYVSVYQVHSLAAVFPKGHSHQHL